MTTCRHCGLQVPSDSTGGDTFCCAGCRAAYEMVRGLGLERYYERRILDPATRPLRPDEGGVAVNYAVHAIDGGDGSYRLHLMVDGLHCAACVWLIEAVLGHQEGVEQARVNMTTRRLVLRWRGPAERADELVAPVLSLGYRLAPFDPAVLQAEGAQREKELLRALAVAGFAAGNVMLLSVAVWAGHAQGMGPATRDLLHWISALIALPAIVYAGRPFFRSALGALAARRVNMDVPISLAVILAAGMSLFETIKGGEHAYFDSAITLLFFLLIGRYLDRRARGRARSSAEHLLSLAATAVTIVDTDGRHRLLPPNQVSAGARVFCAAGDRISVDGRVLDGTSDVDTALISGETVPVAVSPGAQVFAGTLNLTAPLTITVTAVGEGTLLAEIVRLMEAAEHGRSRHVALADRVARLYAPVVHGLALVTFVGWWGIGGIGWQAALLNAIAVLIITCPCALGLAVPVVQVVASGRLLRRGILVKSATALERLAAVDTVVFDKTGTLTEGHPELTDSPAIDKQDLAAAAAIAAASRHPLARALRRAMPEVTPRSAVREVPGAGLEVEETDGATRLGSRAFCGIDDTEAAAEGGLPGPELWFIRPDRPPIRFGFADRPRSDAIEVVAELRRRGLAVELLSGDRPAVVGAVAAMVGIDDWRAAHDPEAKCSRLSELAEAGHRVLMVGDGLNDAPALAAAHVSLSPATAADVSQTAADVVFQGERLAPVIEGLDVAGRAGRLVRQNLFLAFAYNAVTIPLAVAGLVTPLVAAAAMSASSLVVIVNALRLGRRRA